MYQRLAPTACVLGALLSPAAQLHAGGLPSRASLAGVSSVGEVGVSVAGRSKTDEARLREVVERRLENAGIAIDSSQHTQLAITVTLHRNRSDAGVQYFFYTTTVSFREPVRNSRTPRTTLVSSTWSSSRQSYRFGRDVPVERLEEDVEDGMTNFITAVEMDTKAARPLQDQP